MALLAPDIECLRETIARHSGNIISPQQSYLLEARLSPVAASAGLEDVHALVAELQRKPYSPLHDQVTEAMTINETSFFRDMQPFDALRDEVIPKLIESRGATRAVSIWSAASSSGQEAYSLAILLRSHFPELHDWNVRILATDYSDEMVGRVKEGSYTQFEVNRGLPAAMLVRNFDRDGMNWKVKPELRAMVDCRQLNLTEGRVVATKHDVIFLRNVLIYFDQKTKDEILYRMYQSLRPDGYLFLGGGETLIRSNAPFERATIGKTVCFRPVKNQES